MKISKGKWIMIALLIPLQIIAWAAIPAFLEPGYTLKERVDLFGYLLASFVSGLPMVFGLMLAFLFFTWPLFLILYRSVKGCAK